MKRQISFLVLFLMVFCLACDDFEKNTYRAFLVMGGTYDGVMTAAGTAYKDGLIDEETKQKIIDVGSVFYGSYHSSRELFKVYLAAKENGAREEALSLEQKVQDSVFNTLTLLNEFVSYYNSVAEGVNGMKKWEEKHEIR